MKTDRISAVTHSAWINAWTLGAACRELGVDFAVEVQRRDLPLPRLMPGRVADWIFFTDERSLANALQSSCAQRFWPRKFPAELLDDKWAFAAWLAEDRAGPCGMPQWPLDAQGPLPWPLLLKARHSWRGERKLPRGEVCRSPDELRAALARMPAAEHGWYFLQQWFGDAPMRLLSVGGFFDAGAPERSLAAVTERMADYGAGPSSSAMLTTIADPLGLLAHTERVLRRLDYTGPYELEFVVVGDEVRVLELNPRFWMQHGLFLSRGNGLVKRYLGCESAADRERTLLPPGLLWVDGFWMIRQLVRGRLKPWLKVHSAARKGQAVICPPPAVALRALVWRSLGGR